MTQLPFASTIMPSGTVDWTPSMFGHLSVGGGGGGGVHPVVARATVIELWTFVPPLVPALSPHFANSLAFSVTFDTVLSTVNVPENVKLSAVLNAPLPTCAVGLSAVPLTAVSKMRMSLLVRLPGSPELVAHAVAV